MEKNLPDHSLDPLWQPKLEHIESTNMHKFCKSIEKNLSLDIKSFEEFYQWSINQPEDFWSAVWSYTNIKSSVLGHEVLGNTQNFMDATWFAGARLNFAENLLRNRTEEIAIIERLENGERNTLTFNQLYNKVEQCAAAMREMGIVSGDRVAGFLPNTSHAVVAMLATSSIGAIWSSCSPDFGINGVMDRFGQITPKLLFGCNGYYYNGKTINSIPILEKISKSITSIEKLVMVPVLNQHQTSPNQKSIQTFDEFLVSDNTPNLTFEQLPFNHPLFIMYSSGTTGVPKCIVHGAGGTLIQHLKEHQLHVNLKPGDKMFFYTTCGWMMWNWLVSALASEVSLILFDGSPFYPKPESLFDITEEEKFNVLGLSAKYISALEKSHVRPIKSHNLKHLNTILSTGSPLSHESFKFIYRDIKKDLCLSSISGGTDILSCFVLGNPCLPVWEGEIQCRGLGMAVEIWDENGRPIIEEKGELVCKKPFPSAPLYFWDDPNNEKYLNSYFKTFPGIWTQGDYGEITKNNGVIIYGRSDAVLNPGGVRIGTAEIYRQVEKISSILDCVCIGQTWQNDIRVILFIVLKRGILLNSELEESIRETIRNGATRRHVPAKIIAVTDIPRTISGKISELAVRKIVHNEIVKNTDALINPESLSYFKNISDLQT
jgi:acetoacetyl-CoA synthetase